MSHGYGSLVTCQLANGGRVERALLRVSVTGRAGVPVNFELTRYQCESHGHTAYPAASFNGKNEENTFTVIRSPV